MWADGSSARASVQSFVRYRMHRLLIFRKSYDFAKKTSLVLSCDHEVPNRCCSSHSTMQSSVWQRTRPCEQEERSTMHLDKRLCILYLETFSAHEMTVHATQVFHACQIQVDMSMSIVDVDVDWKVRLNGSRKAGPKGPCTRLRRLGASLPRVLRSCLPPVL